MKICLKKATNMCSCNEYNLTICCDGCIGREIRRNLPKCICGDGIKINIIVTGCDGVLTAPALPCSDLVNISSPIKVIRRNPCCTPKIESCCSDFSVDSLNFNMDDLSNDCYMDSNIITERSLPQEYAIIVRSFSPELSQFLCKFPQMYISDCENTIKLIFIFDKKGSIIVPQNNYSNCGGGCGFGGGCGGFGGGYGGFGGGYGGCGCGGCGGFGLFGIAALALLFCC